MKVYVIGININDEADEIAGIFDTEEKARQIQEELSPYVDPIYGECDVTYSEWELNDCSQVEFWLSRKIKN